MRNVWIGKKEHLLLLFVLAFIVLAGAVPGYAQQHSATPKDLLPLHLEPAGVSILRMPTWVALSEGIYKKNGLDVDQCNPPFNVEELKNLGIEAPAQYSCGNKAPAAGSSSNGQNNTLPAGLMGSGRDAISLVGLGATFFQQILNPQTPKRVAIVTSSDVTCFAIYAREGITTPEQLKGKRIGYGGFTNIHGFQLLVLAQAMGWDPRYDWDLVDFPGIRSPEAIKALQSGELDAIVALDSVQLLAMKAGYKPVVDFQDWKVPMASASANVDVEWLKKNRETARRFVKSQVEARAVMERDRGAFNRTLVKYFNMTDSTMQDHLYSMLPCLPRKPYPAAAGLERTMKLYDSYYPQLRQHRVSEFIDDSFVRELDQSGYIDSLYK